MLNVSPRIPPGHPPLQVGQFRTKPLTEIRKCAFIKAWNQPDCKMHSCTASCSITVGTFPMSDFAQIKHKDCRSEFRSIADKYRLISRILWLFTVPALGCWLFSWTEGGLQIGMAGFIIIVAGGFIFGAVTLPKLICPSCCHRADQEVEQFCPECGSFSLESEDGLLSVTRCRSCGKRLVRGKRRRYKIRYCTICGAYLDNDGV